jgi:AcrR family transcriptional regulator
MRFTMDRRDRQRLHTAAEIVDAAERIVLRADLEGLTVHGVAEAIGMTAGALYRYFPSRDAIVAAVQLRVVVRLAAAVDDAVRLAPDDDLARIVAVGDGIVSFARAEPNRYALLARMLAVPRPLVGDREAAEVLPTALAAVARVEALFAAARTRGALSPGDDRLRMLALWAAVHGATQLDKLSRFSPEIDGPRVAREAVDTLLAGWRSA